MKKTKRLPLEKWKKKVDRRRAMLKTRKVVDRFCEAHSIALQQRLWKARLEAGLTQREAGAKLGRDQTYIAKIETGIRDVGFVEVQQLAAIYAKPFSDFATVPEVPPVWRHRPPS
jgi:hypothetical protein